MSVKTRVVKTEKEVEVGVLMNGRGKMVMVVVHETPVEALLVGDQTAVVVMVVGPETAVVVMVVGTETAVGVMRGGGVTVKGVKLGGRGTAAGEELGGAVTAKAVAGSPRGPTRELRSVRSAVRDSSTLLRVPHHSHTPTSPETSPR